MKRFFLLTFFALLSVISYGGVIIEFDNPPANIRDGVRDSLTVRFKVSGLSGTGPWTVSYIKLYEDDVFSDDLIESAYSPVTPAGVHGFKAPYPIPEECTDGWMVRELSTGSIGQVKGEIKCANALNDPKYWIE